MCIRDSTISVKDGDELTATTEELSVSDKIGVYLITVRNNENQEIAHFKGTVYRTSIDWVTEDK